MREAMPPLPQYVLMAWCLVKHRNNFTLNKRESREFEGSFSCVNINFTYRFCVQFATNEISITESWLNDSYIWCGENLFPPALIFWISYAI
jgi:hypothetical protein